MSRPKKTLRNPYQLTAKQKLVIADIVEDIKEGKGVHATKSHQLIYRVKDKRSASVVASENLAKLDFRQAIIEGLRKKRVLGVKGKLQQRLAEGLDAIDIDNNPELRIRLAYIQEVNKLLGTYAPTKIDQRSLKITTKVTPKQLDERIDAIQEELTPV